MQTIEAGQIDAAPALKSLAAFSIVIGMGLCIGEDQPLFSHFELPAINDSKLFVAARLPARPFILDKTGSFAVCISNHLPIIDSVRISVSSVPKYLYKSVLLGSTGIVSRQN